MKNLRNLAWLLILSFLMSNCSTDDIEPPKVNCATSDLSATAEATETACGSATASVEVVATGGLAPYLYKLDDGDSQSSSSFDNVAPGLYQITVTDANSCTFIVNLMVKSTTSYTNQIAPIINANCSTSGCHDGSTSLPDFRSLATVQANALNIKSFTQTGFMPQNGTLAQNEIDLIACWVDDGAPSN